MGDYIKTVEFSELDYSIEDNVQRKGELIANTTTTTYRWCVDGKLVHWFSKEEIQALIDIFKHY